MNLRPISSSLAAALLASTLCASAAHAQAFLRIDGIAGESTDERHKDEISVGSYSYGGELAVDVAGAGRAAGKPSFDALAFTHNLDRASASLVLALAQGQHIKTAVLTVRKPGASSDFLKITLTDVMVSSVKTSGDGAQVTEAVTLVYAKIQIDYSMTGRDGKLTPGGKMSWDVAKNTGG